MRKVMKNLEIDGRESVEYSTPITVTSQFYFCGIPFRVDTYRGCSHMCQYCFANTRKSGTGFGDDFKPAVAKIETFEKMFKKAFGTEKEYADVNVEALRHRLPLHLGGMSDPMQHREQKYEATYKFLKLLREYDYPVAISTKNVLFTEDKYMKVLTDMKAMMQVSIIDSHNLPELEPGASTVEERFDAVKKSWDVGLPAHIRLQPFIPDLIKDREEYVSKVAETGCPFVSIEHLKLPLDYEFIKNITTALGYDIKKRMKELAGAGKLKAYGREFELPPVAKYNLLLGEGGFVHLLHKHGIKYGAADNQLHHFNDSGCCCGVDLYKGFENYFKANYTYMMATNKGKKNFTFDDLIGDHWIPEQDINDNMNRSIRWADNNPCRYLYTQGNLVGRLAGDEGTKDLRVPNKVYYHLRNKWHNPDLNDSPTDLYMVKANVERDELFDSKDNVQTKIKKVYYTIEEELKALKLVRESEEDLPEF